MKIRSNLASITSLVLVTGFLVASTPTANAALLVSTLTTDAVSLSNTTATVMAGETAKSLVSASFDADGNGTKFGQLLVAVTSKPAGSTVAVNNNDGAGAGTSAIAANTGAANTTTTVADGDKDVTIGDSIKTIPATNAGTEAADTFAIGTLTVTPDVAGTYVITVTGTDKTAGAGAAGTANAVTATFTITAYTTGQSTVGKLACTVSLEASPVVSTCTGQVGGQVKVIFGAAAAGTYTVTASNATMLSVTNTEGKAGAAATVAASSYANSLDYKNGWSAVVAANNLADADHYVTTITASAAGTTAFEVRTTDAATGAVTVYDSLTITWATSSSLDPSAGFSTEVIDGDAANAAAFDATSDDTIIASGLTAGTQVALIKVTARDGNNNLLADGKTVTAAITGPGTAGGAAADEDTYANSSRYETVTLAGGTGLAFFAIYADGTAGKSTIQILAGTTVLSTETVTFHGRPTKVTVTQNHRIGSINGEVLGQNAAAPTGADIDNTPAVTVAVTDALGLPVSGQTISAATSDATVMAAVSGTCTESSGAGAGDGYAGEGFYNCSVTSVANAAGSGKTATLTFRVPDGITSGVFVTAAPITYTLGRDPVKVTMKTDKATYAPGEKMTLTISGFGSDDKAAADDIYTTLISATGVAGLVSSGTLPTASVALVNGVKTYTLYAPLVGGTFSFTGTTGVDTGAGVGTAVSTSYQVTDGKAAIATQIDALNAKIVALNALIAKIMKKLGVR
jgi:hypothetical protein